MRSHALFIPITPVRLKSKTQPRESQPIVIKSEEDEKSGSPTGVGCGPHKTICGLLSKVRHLHLLKVLNWLPSQTGDWKNNDKLRTDDDIAGYR